MRYGEVLTRSFEIAWRRRYLWFLAVLAGEGAGGGGNLGNFGGNFGQSSSGRGGGAGGESAPDLNGAWRAVGDWVTVHLGLIIAVGLLLALVWVALFLLSCVAQGAVIRAAAEHDADRPYGLGPAWGAGVHAFWRVLGLRLVYLLVGLLVVGLVVAVILLAIAAAVNQNQGALLGLSLFAVVLAIAFIPFALVWSVVYQLAMRAVVLELAGPLQGVRRGFRLVSRRFGRVVLTWLIYLGVGIAAGIVLGIVTLIPALPFVALGVAAFAAHNLALLAASIALGLLVVIAVGLVAGGAVGAFLSAYWTLAFRRLDLDPVLAPPAPIVPAAA